MIIKILCVSQSLRTFIHTVRFPFSLLRSHRCYWSLFITLRLFIVPANLLAGLHFERVVSFAAGAATAFGETAYLCRYPIHDWVGRILVDEKYALAEIVIRWAGRV